MARYLMPPSMTEQMTDLLMDNGCTVNKHAMRELTIFIVESHKRYGAAITRELERLNTALNQELPLEDAGKQDK